MPSSNAKQRPIIALFMIIFITQKVSDDPTFYFDSRCGGGAKLVTSRPASDRIISSHERTKTAVVLKKSRRAKFLRGRKQCRRGKSFIMGLYGVEVRMSG